MNNFDGPIKPSRIVTVEPINQDWCDLCQQRKPENRWKKVTHTVKITTWLGALGYPCYLSACYEHAKEIQKALSTD